MIKIPEEIRKHFEVKLLWTPHSYRKENGEIVIVYEPPIPIPSESKESLNHEDHQTLGQFHREALKDVLHFPKE